MRIWLVLLIMTRNPVQVQVQNEEKDHEGV